MFNQARGQALALFLTLLVAGTGYGQAGFGTPGAATTPDDTAAKPASPVVAVPPLWKCGPDIPPASIWPLPQSGCGCGPAACAPYEDRNGPLLVGDPLLDGRPAGVGWLVGVELAGIVPHIENKLTSPVTLSNGVTDPAVHLPTANLGANVMPKIELGYRFGQGFGEFTLSYRIVAAQGSQYVSGGELPQFAPTGAVTSRLNLQTLDLDYGSYEPSLGPGWDMKWRVGARGIMYYADSQGADNVLAQQTTDRYWGIGPHVLLEVRRWLGHSGFALFGRVDASMPFGRLTQGYIETATAADGTTASGETRLFLNSEVATVACQFGVTWTPPDTDRFRVTAGYVYEHFFDLGAISTGVAPREDLSIQGGFLRAEWNY